MASEVDLVIVDCEKSVNLKWTIEELDKLTYGQRVTPFLVCSEPWFIVCWPRGNKNENYKHISCALFTRNTIDYTYQISENLTNKCSERIVIKGNQFIGIPRLRDMMYSSTVTLTCKITINIDAGNHNQGTTLHKAISDNITKVSNDFEVLFLDKSSSDVEIIGRNRRFPAHKLILSSRSPVFKAMFSSDMKENLENTLEIKDMDDDVLDDMLKYIYFGASPNLVELAPRLTVVADKYDLGGQKDLCELQIIENLSIDNFCSTFLMSVEYKLEKLKTECLSWGCNNMCNIVNSPQYKEITISKPELMMFIIQYKTSFYDDEWIDLNLDFLSK